MPPIPYHVEDYCRENGFTEPFLHQGQWWAFPPGGVMPVKLPLMPTWSLPMAPRFNFSNLGRGMNRVRDEAFSETLEETRRRMLVTFHIPAEALLSVARAFGQAGVTAAQAVEALRDSAPVVALDLSNSRKIGERIQELSHHLGEVRSSDPLQAIICKLERCHRMQRAIARVRVLEFCERENISFEDCYRLLSQKKIVVKFGNLYPGKGFLKARKSYDHLQH